MLHVPSCTGGVGGFYINVEIILFHNFDPTLNLVEQVLWDQLKTKQKWRWQHYFPERVPILVCQMCSIFSRQNAKQLKPYQNVTRWDFIIFRYSVSFIIDIYVENTTADLYNPHTNVNFYFIYSLTPDDTVCLQKKKKKQLVINL